MAAQKLPKQRPAMIAEEQVVRGVPAGLIAAPRQCGMSRTDVRLVSPGGFDCKHACTGFRHDYWRCVDRLSSDCSNRCIALSSHCSRPAPPERESYHRSGASGADTSLSPDAIYALGSDQRAHARHGAVHSRHFHQRSRASRRTVALCLSRVSRPPSPHTPQHTGRRAGCGSSAHQPD